MSDFSDFIRNAPPEEKAVVYDDVMRKAIARQNASLPATDTTEPSIEDSGPVGGAPMRKR